MRVATVFALLTCVLAGENEELVAAFRKLAGRQSTLRDQTVDLAEKLADFEDIRAPVTDLVKLLREIQSPESMTDPILRRMRLLAEKSLEVSDTLGVVLIPLEATDSRSDPVFDLERLWFDLYLDSWTYIRGLDLSSTTIAPSTVGWIDSPGRPGPPPTRPPPR